MCIRAGHKYGKMWIKWNEISIRKTRKLWRYARHNCPRWDRVTLAIERCLKSNFRLHSIAWHFRFEHSETAPATARRQIPFQIEFSDIDCGACFFSTVLLLRWYYCLPYTDSSFAHWFISTFVLETKGIYVAISNVVISDCCLSFITASGFKYVTDHSPSLHFFFVMVSAIFTVSVHKLTATFVEPCFDPSAHTLKLGQHSPVDCTFLNSHAFPGNIFNLSATKIYCSGIILIHARYSLNAFSNKSEL